MIIFRVIWVNEMKNIMMKNTTEGKSSSLLKSRFFPYAIPYLQFNGAYLYKIFSDMAYAISVFAKNFSKLGRSRKSFAFRRVSHSFPLKIKDF